MATIVPLALLGGSGIMAGTRAALPADRPVTLSAPGPHGPEILSAPGPHPAVTLTSAGPHQAVTLTSAGRHQAVTLTGAGAHQAVTLTGAGRHQAVTLTGVGRHRPAGRRSGHRGAALVNPGVGPGDSAWPASSSPVRNTPQEPASTGAPPTPHAPPGWTLRAVTLSSGGHTRYYLVARPKVTTARTLPILMVLHGRDMTPARILRLSGFLRLVGQAVVVYPAGYAQSWNAGYCCGVAHLAGIDDVAFLESVIRSVLASQPGTAAGQVYLAGFSNGGRMAYRMACADSSAFAGVASVEAVAVYTCDHPTPVPLLEIASTGDPLLTIPRRAAPKHIAGHVEVTVDALVRNWRLVDRCGPDIQAVTYSRDLTISSWGDCRSDSRVELAVYRGGRHTWPSGERGESPSASQLIWSFFRGALHPSGPAPTSTTGAS